VILRSIELKSFGRFVEASYEFRRGLNLVVGPNEAGKSTLAEAIPATLFGLRDKQRYRSWGRQGPSCCTLVFEHATGSVRIQRSLHDDQVHLEERDQLYQPVQSFSGKVPPQGRSSERRIYLEQVQRLIGFSDDALFRASLLFGQGQLAFPSQAALATRLRQLLSGSDRVDFDQVLESLMVDYFRLTRTNPWGKDKTQDRELERLLGRRDELEAELARQLSALSEHAELTERIAQLSGRIMSAEQELGQGGKYLDWIKNRWHLESRREALARELEQLSLQRQQVERLLRRQQELRQQQHDAGLPLPSDDEVEFPLAELRQLRLSQQALQVESQRLQRQFREVRRPSLLLFAMISLLLALPTCGLGWYWIAWRPELFGAAGILGLLPWLWCARRSAVSRMTRTGLTSRLEMAAEQRLQIDGQLLQLEARLQPLGLSPEQVLDEGFQKRWEQTRRLRAELGETLAALKVLPDIAALEERERQVLGELAVADERYEKIRPLRVGVDLDPDDLPDAEQRLAELKQDLDDDRQQLFALQSRQHALMAIVQNNRVLAEEHATVERQIVQARRKVEALQLGCDVLRETVEEFRGGYLGRLAQQAGRRLSPLTSGRYRQLRFDEQFQVEMKTPQGAWQSLEQFSAGTRDAVQMVVRIALLELLAPGHKLPLLIDDSLVNLDQGRQQKFLELLEKLSPEHQVIVFSHDPKLLGRAARDRWHVIPLDHGASRPEKEESHVGQLHLL